MSSEYFVWSGSAQDDSDAYFNSSTLAFTNLDTALGTAAAGDTLWVAHDHDYTYAADVNLDGSGTVINPVKIICVNRATGAITNTAKEKTTNTSHSLNITIDNIFVIGVSFNSADIVTTDQDANSFLKDLTIELSASSGDHIYWNYQDHNYLLENVWFKFGYAGQRFFHGSGSRFMMIGGGIDTAGAAINNFLECMTTGGGKIEIRDADLSNVASAVIKLSTAISSGIFDILLSSCKLPTSIPVLDNSTFSVPHRVRVISCDYEDDKNYFEETYLEGQIVKATNCRVSDFSAKMISNTNAIDSKRPLRFKLSDFHSTANPTIVVETITDGVTLQNDEFWIEVEYPDATDEALRKIDSSSRQEVGWSGGSGPGSPANLTTSTTTWTEDLTSEIKQKIEKTISGGAAGIHTVWACLAKPSTTVYVDPDVTVS